MNNQQMLEQEQQIQDKKRPLYYFKFQMRLEFIPFIQQEIKEFIAFAEAQINKSDNVAQILIILNKRIKDIDRFYDQNWSDYRAQQIQRSRQFLVQFCKRNHSKISQNNLQKQASIGETTPVRMEKISNVNSKETKTEPRPSDKMEKVRESPVVKKSQIQSIDRLKHSNSKSFSKQKPKISAIQAKTSPYMASPSFESPSIPSKESLSREKKTISPQRATKKIESPAQKKVMPARKLTKEEYINYLRTKKANQ